MARECRPVREARAGSAWRGSWGAQAVQDMGHVGGVSGTDERRVSGGQEGWASGGRGEVGSAKHGRWRGAWKS